MIVSDAQGFRCLDQHAMWRALRGAPQADRLRRIIELCGGSFADDEHRFLLSPVVMLHSFGGMPIVLRSDGTPCVGTENLTLPEAVSASVRSMGYSAMGTYLNPMDRDEVNMADLMLSEGTPSVAHIPQLGVMIAGLSAKAELELCCQRDLVHLSRLTSARTAAQDDPPILLEDPSMRPIYEGLLSVIPQVRSGCREASNSVFPLSKCSLIGISGGLKNMTRLSGLSADSGKEREVRTICERIGDVILGLSFRDGRTA